MFIDSHCHLDRLDLEKYNGDLSKAIAFATENGVDKMLCVSIDIESYPDMINAVKQFDQIYFSVGVHPCEKNRMMPDVNELAAMAYDDRIIAIGETGLDYYYEKGDLDWQRERFSKHLQAANLCGKPVIIHSRDAREDTISIMKSESADNVGGVMHCFVDNWEMAKQAIDLNFYISFSGIVTFKNAKELQEVARKCPLDRMMIETDSPYLAPVPHRGKSNEPAYVKHVAECLAELKGVSLEEIAENTTSNFMRCFKL